MSSDVFPGTPQPTDETEVKRILGGVVSFQDDMRAKGIHVGMRNRVHVVRCVTCDEVWPCRASGAGR